MNTRTIRTAAQWRFEKTPCPKSATVRPVSGSTLGRRTRMLSLWLIASVATAAIMMVVAAWVISTYETPAILQAMVWASGFVFLAMAMESKKPDVGLLLATGFALPVLAVLSSKVAADFAIVAVALVAAWVAVAIFRFRCFK